MPRLIDREAVDAFTVRFLPLVTFIVDRFLRESAPHKKHLRDDLVSEGSLALVKGVAALTLRGEPLEDSEYARNYLALCVKGSVTNFASKLPRGFSPPTAARRKAEGIDDPIPTTQRLTSFIDLSDTQHDDIALVDLKDEISAACLDDTDADIFRLKLAERMTNQQVADHLHISLSTVRTRLINIWNRMDHQ